LRGTGDAPESLSAARCVLTLHNIGYQGVYSDAVLAANGFGNLEPLIEDTERAHGSVVFLKLGIRHADAVTTVSPTYAREIQTPEYGMALERLLSERRDDLFGILNGVDYRLWGPETDPYLEHRYAPTDLEGKRRVKKSLCAALHITRVDAPLIGVVTRLVSQKGIDLLVEALPVLLEETRANFALLGSGEADLEKALGDFAVRYPERISFTRGYDEALAHRILAGSDLLLVPSRYEPCGLTQMYALRYGTIPVVRATGGLADTIEHFDPATGAGNGARFEHADAQGLLWGLNTALGWYAEPQYWQRLMQNAMQADFSWERQAKPYEALYERLVGDVSRGGASGSEPARS
jgi:starch synthase